jgi:hypothetical protein
MLDRRLGLVLRPGESHYIEPSWLVEQAMFLEKLEGKLRQFALFSGADGFGRMSRQVIDSRFDFDEYYLATIQSDQVQLAAPAAQATT